MKRLYPDQPAVGIGIVIIKNQRIVLIKRGNEPARGKWTIPGGLVELGESNEAAVIREAKEETCLDVENPRLIDAVSQVDLDEEGKIKYHYVIVDYLVQVRCGDITAASDAVEFRWVALDEVETYDLTASFRRFFKNNREKLANADSFIKPLSDSV
ncbi:MAG: NUDIX hydrolase [Nitrososphaerota archaeon]|uniref:NUDIX hydrolase n=1 Tax=Candidatus Bathycorpusculum sp. TaxID=2994959 RepID=UPI00281A91C0|nr:NUDIX hydrolase [Candidatus Termitimicrobium sp.]MDR0493504.1 NUDIX hydrolase [Nitrososphaerota archaeon]